MIYIHTQKHPKGKKRLIKAHAKAKGLTNPVNPPLDDEVQVVKSADVPLSAKVKTEEVETDDDAEDESADVALSSGNIKTEEEVVTDGEDNEVQVAKSADVPLSAKLKTEEEATDGDAKDESADVPLSADIKTEEEAADVSKSTKEVSKATVCNPVQKEDESQSVASTMMPSWNKSAKKWKIPISLDNSKGLLPYSSLPAATDIHRQQKKEMNRQRCLAKL